MDEDKNTQSHPPTRRDADFPAEYYPDDEISLYDLWNVLERRWYVIVGVFLLVVALAFVHVLNREPAYNFRTGIEIGTVDAEGELVETPQETRNQLNDFVIPSVRVDASQETENVPNVQLSGGDESRLLVLSTTGTVDRKDRIEALHQDIVDRLVEVHDGKTQHGLRELGRQLDQVQNERETLQSQLDRLESRRDALEERVKVTRSIQDDLQRLNERMISDADTSPLLSTALGTQELSRLQERLDELEDELRFELDEERDKLESSLQEAQLDIERIKDDIDNVASTSASFVATRSLEQAGTGNMLILALSVVLGGMLGLFGAFFWEFVSNARKYRKPGQ